MYNTKRVTTSIRIDPKVWKEAKKLSIDLSCSVGELMENIIKKELEKRK